MASHISKLLFAVSSALFMQAGAYASADLILLNGKVFTANADEPQVSALAIKDGKILAVGGNEQMEAMGGERTRRIDLAGKRVMPGLVDAHAHVVFGGLQLISTSLEDEELPVKELESYVVELLDQGDALQGDIIFVQGMHSSYWSQIAELNRVFNSGRWTQRPIVFLGSDFHTAWINQPMRRRAGIDAHYVESLASDQKHTIGVGVDGMPNGLVIDAGWDRVSRAMPKLPGEVLETAAVRAVKHLNSLGITAWMDPAANAAPGEGLFAIAAESDKVGVLPAYKALAERGELTAHVAALLVAPPKGTPQDLDALAAVQKQFAGVANLSFPGIKIFADGVLEYPAQSAAMLHAYHGKEDAGHLLIDPRSFGDLVSAADERGWIVHIHAIGDRAVRESLNGIAKARSDRQSRVPHSITHIHVANPADFKRFKELNVAAVMQLLWATADHYTVDLIQPYIDPDAYRYQYPARSLLQAGAEIAGASDWPISPPNPWEAIHQAISRAGPLGVLNEAERMPREQLFYAYTRNAARAAGLEAVTGTLEIGKSADFIILDRDVFSIEADEIADTRVLSTFFAGSEVYAP